MERSWQIWMNLMRMIKMEVKNCVGVRAEECDGLENYLR